MQKTYINYFEDKSGKIAFEFNVKDEWRGGSNIKYLFTLEINENGEPRTFKHELPKEPVKRYFNFFRGMGKQKHYPIFCGESTNSSLEEAEQERKSRSNYIDIELYLFTKCFDETGKEYPIEE